MKEKLQRKEKMILMVLGLAIVVIASLFGAAIYIEQKVCASSKVIRDMVEKDKGLDGPDNVFREPIFNEINLNFKFNGSNDTREEKEATISNDDYIIPVSNVRELTEKDLEALSQEELLKARNEIYARHGRMFDDSSLQAYFNSKTWYQEVYEPDEFPEDALSDLERRNAKFILDYEKEKGYM